MDRETFVYVDLDGVPHLMGRLWAHVRKNKESATFEYDKAWQENPARFSLEPALQVGPGPFHTPADTPMFGAIGDSAPDRWGRALMRRMERRRAEREGTAPRTLHEIDFLLLVDDEARQGALRFAEREGGPFLREEGVKRIPPLVALPELLSAAEHVMEDKDTEEDLRLLFAPGSSLGGARPKASVIEKDGHLAIAKFPRKDDEIKTVLWEAVALSLAEKSGIPVPAARVENIAGKPVLLLRRFDRDGERRIPFLSALNMLGSKDNETRSYMEIVDALRQHGAAPKADMEALWRRLVFNILISNTDDHLRNHGFFIDEAGIRLSPAYDMNPSVDRQDLTLAINEVETACDASIAMDASHDYGLNKKDADSVFKEVQAAVAGWRDAATRLNIPKAEQDLMSGAFQTAKRM